MRTFQGVTIFFIILLSACGSGQHAPSKPSYALAATTNDTQDSLRRVIDSIEAHLDTLCIPCYDTDLYQVLTDGGIFHGDQVPAGVDDQHWIGLFKSPEGYYLDQTDITVTYQNDAIVDDDTLVKTGKVIQALHTDTVILLMSGPPISARKMVSNLITPQQFPKPGVDTLHFSVGHQEYHLFATGIRRPDNTAYSDYLNYKLYLNSKKEGKGITQIIKASRYEEGDWLLFVGDIDGDGLPDMICIIQGENSSMPTLYLSKDAPPGALLKVVGSWTTTGC